MQPRWTATGRVTAERWPVRQEENQGVWCSRRREGGVPGTQWAAVSNAAEPPRPGLGVAAGISSRFSGVE